MGQGFYANGGRIWSNKGEPAILYFKVTAAADVAASGYTVNEGGDFVSAVTRTAEGDMKIALRQGFPAFLGLELLSTTRADSRMYLDNATNIGSATDPHVDVTFREGTPADTDPDSAVMHFALHVKRTQTSFAA